VEEKSIKKLVTSMKCSSCGEFYKAADVDVIGHRDDLWFLRVACSACQAQYLVAAVVKQERRKSVTVTDLAGSERVRFRKITPINGNDVLDMHRFLKDFDGDFTSLFTRRK